MRWQPGGGQWKQQDQPPRPPSAKRTQPFGKATKDPAPGRTMDQLLRNARNGNRINSPDRDTLQTWEDRLRYMRTRRSK